MDGLRTSNQKQIKNAIVTGKTGRVEGGLGRGGESGTEN